MKNKIILNIVLVYFVVVSIVLVSQLYLRDRDRGETPMTETVKLVDKLNNAVVVYNNSPVMLVNKRQNIISGKNFNIVPFVKNDCFYVPLAFFETAYDAVTEQDFAKRQATLRMENTAVVFSANLDRARVISNSTEKDVQLKNAAVYKNSYAYIPVDAFCDIFDKELFVYNDNMLIISEAEENVAFDPEEEAELLQDIENQVNNLPLVLSENNLKNLLGVKNVLFNFNTEKDIAVSPEQKPEEMVIDNSQSERFAYSGDHIFAVAGGGVKMIDSNGDTEAAVTDLPMQKGFTPESVMTYENMLFVLGSGEDAVMPVKELTFRGDEQDTDFNTAGEKKIEGSGFFILCYDVGDTSAPVLKRWFYADGELEKKQVFENSLCVAVRKNAFDLVSDGVYYAPGYCDLNKTAETKLEEVKYLPEMKDTNFISVFRFDLADIKKSADADVFLGVGNDFVMGQNYVTFNAAGTLPTENNASTIRLTNFYKVNLSSGMFSRGSLEGTLVSVEKANDGYAALMRDGAKTLLVTLNSMLETDETMELSLGADSISCLEDKAYLTDAGRTTLLIVSLTQVYDEAEGEEEPRTVIMPQEKTVIPIDGVEYIKPYETTALGLGKNLELDNAEISMWALKDNAVKTAGDSIGDAGSHIRPVSTKNIVDSEMAFALHLFIDENGVGTEKYNGVYIYKISENNTPVFKGRITHNEPDRADRSITDIAYLNGKYFTVSDNKLMVNADDAALGTLYSIEF